MTQKSLVYYLRCSQSYFPTIRCPWLVGVVSSDSDGDRMGVTDLLQREQVDGVELCSLMYLSTALPLARSALAPGLMGDTNLLPINVHYEHYFINLEEKKVYHHHNQQ